jgi:hypothetical protein
MILYVLQFDTVIIKNYIYYVLQLNILNVLLSICLLQRNGRAQFILISPTNKRADNKFAPLSKKNKLCRVLVQVQPTSTQIILQYSQIDTIRNIVK